MYTHQHTRRETGNRETSEAMPLADCTRYVVILDYDCLEPEHLGRAFGKVESAVAEQERIEERVFVALAQEKKECDRKQVGTR